MAFYIGGNKFSARIHDGSSIEKAAPSLWDLAQSGKKDNGYYWINPNDAFSSPIYLYCDFDYEANTAFALVIANRMSTGGVNSSTFTPDGVNSTNTQSYVTYTNAVNNINYRGSYGNTNLDFNLFVGVKYYVHLGREIVQFVSSSAKTLSDRGNHTKRYKWGFTGMSDTYGFQGAFGIDDETGTGAPGFYSYHAANGYSLSTYDQDQDANGGNCSAAYGNQPWWFGACWDGNYFGHNNGPYWSGSSGDNHTYGAVYIGGRIS
jgi:hypothetical protein